MYVCIIYIDQPFSHSNGGPPDNVYYAQVVYQIQSPYNSWFMKFMVAKHLNALLEVNYK